MTTAVGVLLAVAVRENAKAIALGIGFSTGITLLVPGAELIPAASADDGAAGAAISTGLGAAVLWVVNGMGPVSI